VKYADVKRDVDLGLAVGRGLRLKDAVYVAEWTSTHFAEGVKICHVITTLINKELPEAIGPQGVAADLDRLIYIPSKIADQYRAFLEWTLDCRRVNVDAEFRKLTNLAANFSRNAINEIEQFSQKLQSEIAAALDGGIPEGQRRTISLTLTLTVPDPTDFNQELDRLTRAVVR
jgi:hypothetical protein